MFNTQVVNAEHLTAGLSLIVFSERLIKHVVFEISFICNDNYSVSACASQLKSPGFNSSWFS